MTPDRLAAIRGDLREHGPYRPAFQEDDICPACSRFGRTGAVAWPCGPVRMADALDAVLALCDEWENGEWDEAPRPRDVRAAITDALGGAR